MKNQSRSRVERLGRGRLPPFPLRDGSPILRYFSAFRADERGVEHEVPLGDRIEVGAVDADGVAVALEKHWIRAADTELTLLLDAPPARAGIDPLNQLVDRNPDDNVVPAVEAAVPP